jgi:uncharacterized protein YdaT
MPWRSGKDFAERHNKKLKGDAATKARDVAQAMIAKGVPEGEAIATGNKIGNAAHRYGAKPKAAKSEGESAASKRYGG